MLNQLVQRYRRGTTLKYSFPTLGAAQGGALLSRPPLRVEIHQKQYHHDVLVMEFGIESDNWFKNIVTGLPIAVTFTNAFGSKTWVGKVSFVSKAVTSQRAQTMEVHCVSQSFVLKERANKVFKKKSIPDCVKEIALAHGFKFVGDSHPRVFDQISITGHSYWEWIQEQGKRIGYGVLIDDGIMYFRPLDKLIDQFSTDVPILQYHASNSVLGQRVPDRTLDYFKVFNGEYIESADSRKTIKNSSGVDPVTGKAYHSKKDPRNVGTNLRTGAPNISFNEYRSDQVGTSQADVDASAEGQAQFSRLNLPAKAKGQGDFRLKPFGLVYVDGTGDITDGYWVVKEVKHIWQRLGEYHSEMTLTTDGVGSNQRSAFRTGTASITGTVNLQAALAQSSDPLNVSSPSTIILSSTSAVINMAAQSTNNLNFDWITK